MPEDSAPGVWEGRLRLWLNVNGHNALGPGKVRLLDAIARTESLSAAAKQPAVCDARARLLLQSRAARRDDGAR